MKILIISQHFWPENFRINDLAKKLNENNSVTVLTGLPNYPNGTLYEEFKKNKKSFNNYFGIKILRIPIILRGRGFFKLFLNYLSFILSASSFVILKLRKEKYDKILFFGSTPLTSCYPAILLSKLTKTELYIWLLDFWPDSLFQFNFFKLNIIQKILKFFTKKKYHSFNKIFVQSEHFIELLYRDYKFPKDKIVYLPSWTEKSYVNNEIVYNKKKYIRIVFAGNLGIAQNIPEFIKKIKFIKNTNIKIFFIGDGSKKVEIKKLIKSKNLENNIFTVKSYPNIKMPKILKFADFLLLILKNQHPLNITLPGKFQNYLGLAKPVISISNYATEKIINENKLGFSLNIEELNHKNFINKIESIMYKRDLYCSISSNSLNYSKTNFSEESILNKLIFEMKND